VAESDYLVKLGDDYLHGRDVPLGRVLVAGMKDSRGVHIPAPWIVYADTSDGEVRDAAQRLAAVVELLGLRPCTPPDFCEGFDMCTCQSGAAWPCNRTRAAWLAFGLDVDDERRRIVRAAARRRLPDPSEIGSEDDWK
jgi:hypothetical protein